ncbi:hypothetical protein P9578_28360 [Brevibacillus choshinensis]|uniref:hypothetical protein n=1 Tax=Brevibacillus choshinensis TaxID=54911 RepID=UPI002E1D6E42|nr:hypothetical protein [Brevibacillus choshinensis]
MRYVPVEFNGEEKQLRFDFNALAELEANLGKGVKAIFSEDNVGFHTIRALYCYGLRWKDRGLTIERAGALLQGKLDEGVVLNDLLPDLIKALALSGCMGKEAKEKVIAEAADNEKN